MIESEPVSIHAGLTLWTTSSSHIIVWNFLEKITSDDKQCYIVTKPDYHLPHICKCHSSDIINSNHCKKYNQNVRSLEWHYCHGTLHSFHPIQMTQKEEVEVGNFLDVASG